MICDINNSSNSNNIKNTSIDNYSTPDSFILQWHITERCNLNCKHCYQSKNQNQYHLKLSELVKILDKYVEFLKANNIKKNNAFLHVTGGEPMIRSDFFEFLNEIKKRSSFFNLRILSNGLLVNKNNIKILGNANILKYQVSLEGLEENNDKIRGKGSYKKIINAIKLLVSENITTSVSLTLTKSNLKDVPALSKILIDLGVSNLNTRRIVPTGTGIQMQKEVLEPSELKKYYLLTNELNSSYRKKRINFIIRNGCESSIFNEEQDSTYTCGLYMGTFTTIMPNGHVVLCRRLPIVIGNITKNSLMHILSSSKVLASIRNTNNAHSFCKSCSNFDSCFGGAKCVNYAYTKKLFIPDVQCWRFYKKLENMDYYKNL